MRRCRSSSAIAALVVVMTISAGCVQFGWDRLSTQVPGAVLETIQAEHILAEQEALAQASGAATGQFEMPKALRHVARRMAQLGLESAGEESFLQAAPLRAVRVERVQLAVGTRSFRQAQDLALWSRAGKEQLAVEAPLVFVGHGVRAPERDRDDYAGLDLTGKVALVLSGPLDRSYLGSWYADWRYQCAEAVRHGAIGVLLIHPGDAGDPLAETPPPPLSWESTRDRFTRFQFSQRPAPNSDSDAFSYAEFEAWVPRAAGDELLRAVDIDPQRARDAARSSGFRGRELSLVLDLQLEASVIPSLSYSLVAQIPGRYSEEQSVLIGASLDSSETGLRACAATLELAQAFRSLAEEPARSVVFVIFGAGARGGRQQLSAERYARHPARELSQCAGALILDGGLRKILVGRDPGTPESAAGPSDAATDTLTAGGILDNELGTLLMRAAAEDDLSLRNEEDRGRWLESAAPAMARQGLPAATVGCEVLDLRAAMRVGYHMAQTRGSPRWSQHSSFRFFPR